MTTDVIFFVVLVACSLLIHDAAQLDTNKPYYENFDWSGREKRSRCEQICPCPRGPPPFKAYLVLNASDPEPSDQKEYQTKRFDDAAPRRGETLYSIWRQNRFNYITPIM